MDDSVHITPEGNLVYILIKDRARFDKIAIDVSDHGDNGDKGHLLSKSITSPIYIVFQHWIRSPALPPRRAFRPRLFGLVL